jgi:hypothetical protein
MSTVIQFRARRDEADAAAPRAAAASFPASHHQAGGDHLAFGAEIILIPLTWLRDISRERQRKPLTRRFALRGAAPA